MLANSYSIRPDNLNSELSHKFEKNEVFLRHENVSKSIVLIVLIFHHKFSESVIHAIQVWAWLNGNTVFYRTFVCFYVSEAKPLCFSLCSQMFDGVERC